jgi:hypothetical protein
MKFEVCVVVKMWIVMLCNLPCMGLPTRGSYECIIFIFIVQWTSVKTKVTVLLCSMQIKSDIGILISIFSELRKKVKNHQKKVKDYQE